MGIKDETISFRNDSSTILADFASNQNHPDRFPTGIITRIGQQYELLNWAAAWGINMSVIFRKMNEKEITKIYETRMTKDFPPMELKPLHNIIDMMEQGIYESLLVYDQEPVGYALVLLPKGISYGLLDYLGTFSERRNQGYGAQILKELMTYYQDRKLMIESEYPDDAPDRRMAARRLQFYQRNGAVDTDVESRVFGTHYVNLILSRQQKDMTCTLPPAEEVKDILIQLYTGMLPDEEKRRKYLEFWIKKSS